MKDYTLGQMMIITGMTTMVEDEGTHPREVIESMRKIESDVFFALMDIYRETKGEK